MIQKRLKIDEFEGMDRKQQNILLYPIPNDDESGLDLYEIPEEKEPPSTEDGVDFREVDMQKDRRRDLDELYSRLPTEAQTYLETNRLSPCYAIYMQPNGRPANRHLRIKAIAREIYDAELISKKAGETDINYACRVGQINDAVSRYLTAVFKI